MSDIWERRHKLEKDRRDYMKVVMQEYDKTHYENMRLLREDCEKSTGHNYMFSNLGPLGHAWFYCNTCGKSKVEED